MVIVRRCLLVVLVMGLVIILTGCMQALQTGPADTVTSSSPLLSSTETASVPVSSDSPQEMEPSLTPEVVASGASDLLPPDAAAANMSSDGIPPPTLPPAEQVADLQPTSPVPTDVLPAASSTAVTIGSALAPSPMTGATPDVPSPSPEATATATTAATSAATLPPATTTSEAPTEQLVIIPPTLPVLTHEERWRSQQLNREAFGTPRRYTTSGSQLWWFDPVNQQHVILGSFSGEFQAQASFTLRGQGLPALEVPYKLNESYSLTSVSSVLVDRVYQAGYADWIETYVFVTPNVEPR